MKLCSFKNLYSEAKYVYNKLYVVGGSSKAHHACLATVGVFTLRWMNPILILSIFHWFRKMCDGERPVRSTSVDWRYLAAAIGKHILSLQTWIHRSGSFDWLQSCIGISRVLLDLQTNPPMEGRELKVSFKRHFTSVTYRKQQMAKKHGNFHISAKDILISIVVFSHYSITAIMVPTSSAWLRNMVYHLSPSLRGWRFLLRAPVARSLTCPETCIPHLTPTIP